MRKRNAVRRSWVREHWNPWQWLKITGVEPESRNKREQLWSGESGECKKISILKSLVAVDSNRLGLGGQVFSARFVKRSEDSIRVVEVIVHDIDEERCIHEVRNKFLRRWVVLIKHGPLCTQFKGLVLCESVQFQPNRVFEKFAYLPGHKADCLYNGWLDDFFAWEDTPRHCIWAVWVGIGTKIATLIDDIIRDVTVPFDLGQK